MAFVLALGGCATYRPIAIDSQSSVNAAEALSSRPAAGDQVRVTLTAGERVTGRVLSRTATIIVIGGDGENDIAPREIDIAEIKSLEISRRPLATSTFGGAVSTFALIGVIAGTILLVLDPPFGDS